jgi:1,2-diacylglycerol 3-alpha-glucosyltransferase
VIPTGLPESQFVPGNGIRFRRAWGIGPERQVALFVGRAAFEKNIGFLLEMIAIAAGSSRELMLVIAGEGPALPALRRQAEALRLEDHVRFVGYLPRDGGLRDCYAAADVFTFASHTETQGLVLLEAMAIGLPVLAIPALGAAEIIAPRRGAVPAADTPRNSPANWSPCSTARPPWPRWPMLPSPSPASGMPRPRAPGWPRCIASWCAPGRRRLLAAAGASR